MKFVKIVTLNDTKYKSLKLLLFFRFFFVEKRCEYNYAGSQKILHTLASKFEKPAVASKT